MSQARSLVVALSALLVAPAAVHAAAPHNPFGPEVKTLALRVVDEPDAFRVKPEGLDIGGMIAGTLIFGPAVGIAAKAGNDNSAGRTALVEAHALLKANAPALERFAFKTRLAADLRREIEANGWARVVGEPELVALADPAAKPVPYEAVRLAQTPEEMLAASGADAVLVIRPRLSLEERARYLRLQFDLDAYSRQADGQLRRYYTHQPWGSISHAVDGKRTPPKTKAGQTADYGGRWLADDAARLRAEYELLAAREVPRALSRLRERTHWNREP